MAPSRTLATIGVLSLALGLAACGSSSGSGSTSTTQQAGGRRGLFGGQRPQGGFRDSAQLPNRGQSGPPQQQGTTPSDTTNS